MNCRVYAKKKLKVNISKSNAVVFETEAEVRDFTTPYRVPTGTGYEILLWGMRGWRKK